MGVSGTSRVQLGYTTGKYKDEEGYITWVREILWLSHLRLRLLCTPSSGEMRRRKWIRRISFYARLSPGHKFLFQDSKDELSSRDLNEICVH